MQKTSLYCFRARYQVTPPHPWQDQLQCTPYLGLLQVLQYLPSKHPRVHHKTPLPPQF